MYQELGTKEFLKRYFGEFKERIEAQIGPLSDYPEPPPGWEGSGAYWLRLGEYLAGLKGVDFYRANSEISFEKEAYDFGAKIDEKLKFNGNPCLKK